MVTIATRPCLDVVSVRDTIVSVLLRHTHYAPAIGHALSEVPVSGDPAIHVHGRLHARTVGHGGIDVEEPIVRGVVLDEFYGLVRDVLHVVV